MIVKFGVFKDVYVTAYGGPSSTRYDLCHRCRCITAQCLMATFAKTGRGSKTYYCRKCIAELVRAEGYRLKAYIRFQSEHIALREVIEVDSFLARIKDGSDE